ncbi:MAG: hypothetical protein ACRDTC_28205 [Pseudonocardiaceae bacterium]
MSHRTNGGIVRRMAAGTAVLALSLLALVPTAQANADAAAPSFTKIQGAAGNAAGLQPTVDAYRALLGDPRQEINWDGVPDNLSAPNLMPPDLFNTTVPRGAVFSSWAGNRFQVSADSDSGVPVRFGNLNSQYPHVFSTFSPEKLFAPLGTTTTRVHFFVPGTTTPASVNGFGAVFTDVDSSTSTKIEVYDQAGNRLWWNWVPRGTAANNSLSFLGVKTDARIYEVRITNGNAQLGAANADGGAKDVVAIDDLIFGTPQA